MTPLSVVIITYNEERNLARCLKSVQGVADDIVVVDSFSTDKTKEIAVSYGARFIEHAFDGHIEQKNWAITQAKFPHVLSLDADEALDNTLREEILQVKANWRLKGYKMNRLTNYCGHWVRYCGWYPDTKLRLWDSREGCWTGINPHDEYKLKKQQPVGHLKGNILHYSYYTLADHYKQVEYFTGISSKAYFKLGKRVTVFHLWFSPAFKFIQSYIFKRGFLDGKAGFIICRVSAYASWLKYYKLQNLWKNNGVA